MNKNFVTDWQQQLTRVLTPRQKSDASVLEGSHLEKIRGKFSHIRSKSYDKKSRNIEIIIDRDQTTEGSQRVDSPLHDSSNTNTPLSPRDERRKDSTVNLSQEDKKYWLYNKVITEFIATEKDYHRDMEILATVCIFIYTSLLEILTHYYRYLWLHWDIQILLQKKKSKQYLGMYYLC